jgi:hypothetical protein
LHSFALAVWIHPLPFQPFWPLQLLSLLEQLPVPLQLLSLLEQLPVPLQLLTPAHLISDFAPFLPSSPALALEASIAATAAAIAAPFMASFRTFSST